MKIGLSTILRLFSCVMWGTAGYLSITSAPVIGVLSMLSATCFLLAIVLELTHDN